MVEYPIPGLEIINWQDTKGGNLIDRIAERLHTDRYGIFVLLLLFLFTVFNIIKNCFLSVHIDEANWWMQTRHLTAGYFFHPPFFTYQQFVVTKLFGSSPLALRLGTIFFATFSLYLVFVLSREIFKDGRLAFCSTFLIVLIPVTNWRLDIGFHEAPFLFLWLLTILLLWRAISRESKGYWYIAGISAGLLLLCKLHAVFLFLGIFLFLITSRQHRFWLKRKEPYLAFLIAILMFVPTLIWYVKHNFEPIIYQLSSRPSFLKNGLFSYIKKVITHAGWEMMVLSPFVYLFSLFGILYGGWLGFKENNTRFRFLFWFGAPTVFFFALVAGALYWEFPGHVISVITAMGASSLLVERVSKPGLKKVGYLAFALLLLLVPLLFSIVSNYNMSSDATRYGWKILAGEVEKVREAMPDAEHTIMAAPYYWITSEIAYYDQGKFDDFTLAFRVYESGFLGDNSNYSPWVPLNKLVGRDFIFVDEKDNRDDYETPAAYWEKKLPPYFDRVDEPITITIRKNGRGFRTFYIFKCYGFKGPNDEMDRKGDVRKMV